MFKTAMVAPAPTEVRTAVKITTLSHVDEKEKMRCEGTNSEQEEYQMVIEY